LAGLPRLERLDVRIAPDRERATPIDSPGPDSRADSIVMSERSFRPVSDLVLPAAARRADGVTSRGKVAARIRPLTHDHGVPMRGLTVLFDTSASRALGFDDQVDAVGDLLGELDRWAQQGTRLHVVAFDQSYTTIYEGDLADFSAGHLDALRDRRALGASNLAAALRFAATRARGRIDRVLVVSDGVATAGSLGVYSLTPALRRLEEAGVERVDVMSDGSLRDESMLRGLTRTLDEPGIMLDARDTTRRLVRRMMRGVVNDVSLEVPGASWSYPTALDGLQSGDEVIVYAEFPEPSDSVEVRVGGAIRGRHRLGLRRVSDPLLGSAIAAAHVEDLAAALEHGGDQPVDVRRTMYQQIVELSREQGLLNDYTRLTFSMPDDGLVEVDDRRAERGSVLVVGPTVVERRSRLVPELSADSSERLADLDLRFPALPLGVDRMLLLADAVGTPEVQAQAVTVDRPIDRDPAASPSLDISAAAAAIEAAPDPSERDAARLVADLRHSVVRRLDVPPTTRTSRTGWRQGPRVAGVPPRSSEDAVAGNLLAVLNLLEWGKIDEATEVAEAWREAHPAAPLAIVALGEAHEAAQHPDLATRAYGSLIDLYPGRADIRRFAGTRLEGLGSLADSLAIDTYGRARALHPDNPTSHRLLAFAHVRSGRFADAFDVLARAVSLDYPPRFGAVHDVLREDLALVAAAWAARDPGLRMGIVERVHQLGAALPTGRSLRFVLTWETPASDADLHVRDATGHHAYHESRQLASGGSLRHDVQGGYGPEVFAIDGGASSYPYDLQVHHYSLGPLGIGMGKVEIVEYDGAGGLAFEERPFVVQRERAYVDLGTLNGSLF
jgi:tetratricopeptide (TPR) repeat protein